MTMTESERSDYLALLDRDLGFFMRELWIAIGSEREDGSGRAPLSDVELDLVDFATDTSGSRVRTILGTRGLGKTYLIAASNAAWRLYRDPTRKIVIICKSQKAADKTSTLLRSWVETVWFLQHLRPRKDQRDNVTGWDVGPSTRDRQSSVTALGVAGNLENNRAHTVIVDDVETKANSITFEARERLRHQCGEFINWLYPSIPLDKGGSRDPCEIVYTLTPKHEETIARWLEKNEYPLRAYPLCAPLPDEQTFTLAPMLQRKVDLGEIQPGQCFFSHRFTHEDVADRRRNRSEWLRECQLVRTLGDSDRYPLKLANFTVYDSDGPQAPVYVLWGTTHKGQSTALPGETVGIGGDRFYRSPHQDPNWAPFTGTKMRIDPAGKGKDKTGFVIISHLNGFYFVRRAGGLSGGATEQNLSALARHAYDTNCTQVTVETNFGDAYAALLETHLARFRCQPNTRPDKPEGFACRVDEISSHGQKELRIIGAIEPVLNAHRIVIPTSLAENTEFQTQVSLITRDRGCLEHDDIIDALAGCLMDWKDTFRADPSDPSKMDPPAAKERLLRLQRKYRTPIHWIGAPA